MQTSTLVLDDLVVSENNIGLPQQKFRFFRLPGHFLRQNKAGELVVLGKRIRVINKHLGMTPITANYSQDGYPDLVHVNLAGKSRAFVNNSGSANYFKVKLADT